MNDLTVLLYLLCFAIVVGTTFAFMFTMMKSTLREFDKPKPTRPVHPEEDDDDDGDAIIIRR